MAVIIVSITKGAPKEVMELCSDYYDNQGMIVSLTATERQAILAANDQFARDGLRVLAVAYRPLDSEHVGEDKLGHADLGGQYGLSRLGCHE